MKIKFLILKKKILNKLSHIFRKINPDKVIYDFLNREFGFIKENINYKTNHNDKKTESEYKKNIYVFWWQGYENAPPLVKKCIDSIRQNSGEKTVIIITKKNYQTYANIPDYIIKKLNEKKITLTHFSDILRMCLISEHGGLWVDATIFTSRTIPNEFFEMSYFTIHYSSSTSKITKGKWTGFCQAGQKDSVVQSFCRDVFFAYWEKFDYLIDYFFIDYVMAWGYNNILAIKQAIDSVPLNNEGIKELDKHFNDEYQKSRYDDILKTSLFFKLNWKRDYKLQIDGKDTIYSNFIK